VQDTKIRKATEYMDEVFCPLAYGGATYEVKPELNQVYYIDSEIVTVYIDGEIIKAPPIAYDCRDNGGK